MAKREVEVIVTGRVTMEIDDEAVSDFDGRTLLTCHENPERFVEGSTLRTALAGAAVSVGIWGSRDGWADWPDGAIRAWAFPEFPEIESVTLDGEVVQ